MGSPLTPITSGKILLGQNRGCTAPLPVAHQPCPLCHKTVADKEPHHRRHLLAIVEDGDAPPLPRRHAILLQQLLHPPTTASPHRFEGDPGRYLKAHRERFISSGGARNRSSPCSAMRTTSSPNPSGKVSGSPTVSGNS